MKKFLASFLFVLPLCCYAQKGAQGIGVNLGFETCFYITGYDDALCCKNIPLSIEYHYNLTDRIRIAPHIGYISADEEEVFNTNVFESGLSLHYFLNGIKRFRPYLSGGASVGGYNSVVYHPMIELTRGEEIEYPLGGKYNGLFYGVDFGVGLDCKIRTNLSLQAEMSVHFSSLRNFLYFGPNIGLTYVF